MRVIGVKKPEIYDKKLDITLYRKTDNKVELYINAALYTYVEETI